MLPSVLRSKRAVMVNVGIMRGFVRLRQMLVAHVELARKLAALEEKFDAQFKVVFDAIQELMTPLSGKKRPIGLTSWRENKYRPKTKYLDRRVPTHLHRSGIQLFSSQIVDAAG
jgi:hypothetical protein